MVDMDIWLNFKPSRIFARLEDLAESGVERAQQVTFEAVQHEPVVNRVLLKVPFCPFWRLAPLVQVIGVSQDHLEWCLILFHPTFESHRQIYFAP